MNQREREAVLAISLMAAMADGIPNDSERARLQGIAASLGDADGGQTYAAAYQRVFLGTSTVEQEARELSTPEMRTLAYETAVATCDADGATTPSEKLFLSTLATHLRIGSTQAADVLTNNDLLADAPVSTPPPIPGPPGPARPQINEQELDDSILNYSILNAAIELLPQGLATAAIIPLQMKMVYGIGKKYGYELDSGHIKDFLMTIGVGATSQVVESFARKLLGGMIERSVGGLLGSTIGRTLETVATKGTSVAFTFGSTYALGQVARQYYAGGRKLSAIDLQAAFKKQTNAAQGVYQTVLPKIQEQARKLNPAEVLRMVRG